MALRELDSSEAIQSFIGEHPKALIVFSATWCGPCKASKPDLERMADEYSRDVTKDVKFGIVYEHNLGDSIQSYNVRAFPTYALFVNASELGRIEGVNLQGIRELSDRAGPAIPSTAGNSLGGDGAIPLSKEDARAQRLAKLGGNTVSGTEEAKSTTPPAQEAEEEAEATKDAVGAKDVEMQDGETGDDEIMEEAESPTAGLDPEAIKTLTESMGFSELRAQKGLLYGNISTVEGAVEWLMLHQEDEDIDDPIPDGPIQKAQSYKCNDCGKVLSNMANLELHANKTGHSDFEESTQAARILTPEEKIQKIAKIKELLKAKRTQREEAEKVDQIDREKQRRFMGKEMAKTKEQMDAEQRKREAYLRKKEKDAFKKERERLRAELARDKAERIANKGKLSTKLGVEGYKPDGVQYELEGDGDGDGEPTVAHKKAKAEVSTAKIDEYIQKISSYRAGGDGGKCLKILLAYVGNAADNPDEDKYKRINMENKVFKTKIKPFVGAKPLLIAVGFTPNEDGDAMMLRQGADHQLLVDTKAKLTRAFDAY